MEFMGIPIIESPYAYTREPARIHKHGHKRIQKKWNKRYGFVQQPAVFMIGTQGNQTMVVAPGHSAVIKLALNAPNKEAP